MPIWTWFYRHYFQVQTSGWEHIPASPSPVLFVGSHNGGLASPDLPMMMVDWFRRYGYDQRPIYGLMHPKVWAVFPELAALAEKMGAIRAEPKMAMAALVQGANVLVYPGGAQDVFRPYDQRHRIHLNGRKGFIKLALRQGVPIVPVISWGAHDTLRVLGDAYPMVKQLHDWGLLPWLKGVDPEVFPIYLGLPWGLAIGPLPNLPLPAKMYTRICEPVLFERLGIDASKDLSYVEACYARVLKHMQQELDALIAEVEYPALA